MYQLAIPLLIRFLVNILFLIGVQTWFNFLPISFHGFYILNLLLYLLHTFNSSITTIIFSISQVLSSSLLYIGWLWNSTFGLVSTESILFRKHQILIHKLLRMDTLGLLNLPNTFLRNVFRWIKNWVRWNHGPKLTCQKFHHLIRDLGVVNIVECKILL